MKHISKDGFAVAGSTLVLQLSTEVREKRKKGIKVTDGTIGMLFENNGQLSSLPLFDKALNKALNLENRKYSSVNGPINFQDALKTWIFKGYAKTILKKYSTCAAASMGGTAAIVLAIRNYVDKNSVVLLPDVCWGNYASICQQLERKYEYYSAFKGNGLNLADIKSKVLNEAKKHKRVTIVINDPCHNPSGYTMSEKEWLTLIKLFNEVNKKVPVTLIYDAAYIDHSAHPDRYFKLISKTEAKYLTLFCFSASKSFSVYGLRTGALVGISKDKDDIIDLKQACTATIRAIWSNPNAHVLGAIADIVGDKNNWDKIFKYYNTKHKLMEQRYKKARKYFDPLIKGKMLPYKEGFFFTYRVDNANKIADDLKKRNIYVLPIQNKFIRVAICSLYDL